MVVATGCDRLGDWNINPGLLVWYLWLVALFPNLRGTGCRPVNCHLTPVLVGSGAEEDARSRG